MAFLSLGRSIGIPAVAACLFAAGCAVSSASTSAVAVSPSTEPHVTVACRDLVAVYGPWFSETVVAVTVVEHLNVFPSASQQSVTDLEMQRQSPLTDALYDTVIGYSDLYMRGLSSALVMYRAEARALVAHSKEHGVRTDDKTFIELVRRLRWAFDETTTAWTAFRAVCPPSPSSPSRNLPAFSQPQLAEQLARYVAVVNNALPVTLPDGALRPMPCDGPDEHVGDGRYLLGVQADVAVAPKHLDAIVRLASLLRVRYQITVLRETPAGSGQVELEAYDVAAGGRIALASVAADTMRLTVRTRCVKASPGQSPLPR